jgi:hypothetical protein
MNLFFLLLLFFFFFFSVFDIFFYPCDHVQPSKAAAQVRRWLSSENADVGNAAAAADNIPALFVFGDSMSDTGNGPFVNLAEAYSLPYGETYPGYADGRFSDGRTIVSDFLGTLNAFHRFINYHRHVMHSN